MQGDHIRSSSRLAPGGRQWHIAEDCRIAKGACRLDRGRIHSFARASKPGNASRKIAAAADARDVCDVGAAVRAAGWPADWRLPDEVIEASRLAVLGDHKAGRDLWIYSYGSLMWDPGFHFAEVRLADVEGFQRRFTLKINLGRGSHDHPALMLSLEREKDVAADWRSASPLIPSMLRPRSCGAARCCAAAMRRRWCRC